MTATDTHSGTASVAVTINVNDVDEVGLLGRIVFVVGQGSGMASEYYGYESGNFGSLTSGDFPGGLFDDHTLRTVEAIYETANAEWVLEYSGGTANDWLSDEDALDAITVTVTYDDDVNTRAFVMGGFIETVGSNNRLILAPPLPSRDWDGHDTQTVTMNFHRHVSQAARVMPAAILPPVGTAGSLIAFLSDTVPGGPVAFQLLITIVVFGTFLARAPSTPRGIMFAGLVLMLTPWVPVILGYGDVFAASIVFLDIATGAFAYKVWLGRTE